MSGEPGGMSHLGREFGLWLVAVALVSAGLAVVLGVMAVRRHG